MQKDLAIKLKEEFPILFGNLIYNFECCDGWYDIIYRMAKELVATSEGDRLQVVQLKEKFATLRVYTNNYSSEVNTIIKKYEEESSHTCEICGTKENVEIKGNAWIRTLCTSCHLAREKDYSLGWHEPPEK